MVRNVGSADKAIRIVIAIVLFVIGLVADLGTVPKVLVFIFSAAMLLTSIFGTCFLYTLLGINTVKK